MLPLDRGATALIAQWARGEHGRERLAKAVPALGARVRRVDVLVARVAGCESTCKGRVPRINEREGVGQRDLRLWQGIVSGQTSVRPLSNKRWPGIGMFVGYPLMAGRAVGPAPLEVDAA